VEKYSKWVHDRVRNVLSDMVVESCWQVGMDWVYALLWDVYFISMLESIVAYQADIQITPLADFIRFVKLGWLGGLQDLSSRSAAAWLLSNLKWSDGFNTRFTSLVVMHPSQSFRASIGHFAGRCVNCSPYSEWKYFPCSFDLPHRRARGSYLLVFLFPRSFAWNMMKIVLTTDRSLHRASLSLHTQ